jgi:membrane protease YdiL (CAAX protease family)
MSDDTMPAAAVLPAAKPFPGIWAAIGWVALFMLAQVAMTMAFVLPMLDLSQGVAGVLAQMADVKKIALPSMQAVFATNLLLIGLFALYARKSDRRAALGLDNWGRDGARPTLRIAVILIFAALAFNISYTVLIGSNLEMQKTLRDILAAIPPTVANTAMIMLATVVLAPIAEELIFRGMLQKSLVRRLPIWAAIGISAAVFSAMHGDLNSAPALLVIGAIFGALYHLTGSLKVTILAHLANNLFAILASRFV